MAVTSMGRSSIGDFAKNNRVSNPAPETPWAKISTTPTGTFNDGTYDWNYWVFKANSSVVVSKAGRVDYLVVAGGGSGATSNTHADVGGGGAGGVIESSAFAELDAGTYAVTIGAGGATNSGTERAGNNGSNSSLGAGLVAIGGGAGSYRLTAGVSGGCGGGSGDAYQVPNTSSGGDPTFGQGYRGGHGVVAQGGGGGGAGGPGAGAGSTPVGGIGRITTIISTTIATAQSVGEVNGGNVYFAGGGGCGSNVAGGLGGGGDGSPLNGRGVDCAVNTGGGSGSSDSNLGAPYAGVGGSGVVIVRTRA